MSTTYSARALTTPAQVTPTERLILVLLGYYADDNGMTYVSVGRIASMAQISSHTAARALSSLENAGLVHRLRVRSAGAPLFSLTLSGSGDAASVEAPA